MTTRDARQRWENEIEHARYVLAHGALTVWNWDGVAGSRRWQRRVVMLTARLAPGMRVLEIGCGTGLLTRELVGTRAEVHAIDISPDLVREAQRNLNGSKVTFRVMNACATSFPDASFDAVVGSSTLHHLDAELAISEFQRVLKPGGLLAFTEPNMLNPQIAVQKNVPAIKRRMGDSPDESAFFRWSLGRMLRARGFRDVRVEPFDFLHPWTPAAIVTWVEPIGNLLEKTPVVREIAGSLFIRAIKDPSC